jgi:aldose sugar dehydrogenase
MQYRSRLPRPFLVLAYALSVTGCNGTAADAEPAVASNAAVAEEQPLAAPAGATHDVRAVPVVRGLSHPWGMAFLPDGDLLITERSGRLRLVRNGQLVEQPIDGVPEVFARGQGGLLDVALHPAFERNQLVYLTYSKPLRHGATTALGRGRLAGHRLVDFQDIFVARAQGNTDRHFGSRIAFDRAGRVYITIGDRGEMRRAQDLSDHAGTTIRLHDDGRVPQDNPFARRRGALPEIFTYGNRNAQGMVVHPHTGEIWQNEHGPRGGDEINLIRAGANYGWPEVTHGIDYSGARITDRTAAPGMESPVLHWTPSIAPSGMTVYSGDIFPHWRGSFFIGALANQHLRRVVLDGRNVVEEEVLLPGLGRIRDVRQGPDGYLYLLTDAASGALLRVEPQ